MGSRPHWIAFNIIYLVQSHHKSHWQKWDLDKSRLAHSGSHSSPSLCPWLYVQVRPLGEEGPGIQGNFWTGHASFSTATPKRKQKKLVSIYRSSLFFAQAPSRSHSVPRRINCDSEAFWIAGCASLAQKEKHHSDARPTSFPRFGQCGSQRPTSFVFSSGSLSKTTHA